MDLTSSLKIAISGVYTGTAKPDGLGPESLGADNPGAESREEREAGPRPDRTARLSDRLFDAIVDEDGVSYNFGTLDKLEKRHDAFLQAMKCEHDWQAIHGASNPSASGDGNERVVGYICTICMDMKPA